MLITRVHTVAIIGPAVSDRPLTYCLSTMTTPVKMVATQYVRLNCCASAATVIPAASRAGSQASRSYARTKRPKRARSAGASRVPLRPDDALALEPEALEE